MGIFRKVMALALSVVMIASMSTTFVFAADTPETVPTATVTPTEPTATPTEPTAAPTEPTTTPTEPTATPTEPTATPTEPTTTPTEPTTTPTEPTATPTEPTATPTEPTATPTEPTAAPTEPTAAPTEPTTTPTVPEVVTPMTAGTRIGTVLQGAFYWGDGYSTTGASRVLDKWRPENCAIKYTENGQVKYLKVDKTKFTTQPAGMCDIYGRFNGNIAMNDDFDILLKSKTTEDVIVTYDDGKVNASITLSYSDAGLTPTYIPMRTASGDNISLENRTMYADGKHMKQKFWVRREEKGDRRDHIEPKAAFTNIRKTGTGLDYTYENGNHILKIDSTYWGGAATTDEISQLILEGAMEDGTPYDITFNLTLKKVLPKEIIVAANTIEAINAAIADSGTTDSQPGAPTVVQLPDGEITGTTDKTVQLTKCVTIRGGTGSVIKGSVTVSAAPPESGADNLAARLDNLTLDGTGTTGKTGVVGSASGYGSIMNVTIKNFAVGFDNTMSEHSFAFGGLVLDGNATGLKLKPRAGQRQSTGGMTIKNNTIAGVEIIAGNNNSPYAFELYDCDFTNNTKHIKNGTGLPYNFSGNYYDGYDASANTLSGKFEGNVVYCPRYENVIGASPNKLIIDTDKLGNLPMENGKITDLDTASFAGQNVKLQMDQVDPSNGAATKKASWNFAAADSSLSQTFNPNVDTVLEATSDAAIGTIPAETKYQPVSFKHSGALPGTAEVSIVPDSGNAPNSDLKLYKVVGDVLELQTSPVTMRGGEYVFNRDSASDYVIQGTVVAPSGGSDTSSGGSDDYVSSEDVSDKLNSSVAAGGASVSISVTGAPSVGIGAFEALRQNPGQTLVLRGDGYSWSIKGSDMLSPIAGLLAVNTTISGVSPNAKAIKAITGDAVIQNLYFGYHGNLPFTATINVEVAANLRGKPLNLYHIDGNLKNLMLMESGLVAKDGRVSFPVSSCSDYILTADTIPGATIGKKAMHNVTNPDTGAKDTAPLAAGIALMSVLGMAVLLKDDRKKK